MIIAFWTLFLCTAFLYRANFFMSLNLSPVLLHKCDSHASGLRKAHILTLVGDIATSRPGVLARASLFVTVVHASVSMSPGDQIHVTYERTSIAVVDSIFTLVQRTRIISIS
ncbi:hypothetical protein JB92DRAFT_795417 [Gautieria morchelliformis]|nr:hypothetical protein JB92DRAFT_795417 [Gautieria morchelliformis]